MSQFNYIDAMLLKGNERRVYFHIVKTPKILINRKWYLLGVEVGIYWLAIGFRYCIK